MTRSLSRLFLVVVFAFLFSCKSQQPEQWEGQGEITRVVTNRVPIQPQYKGIFSIGNGIYASNDFEGARLNGMNLRGDTLVTALITPENTPINGSPWYSFKLWADSDKEIDLKLTYLDGYHHRYFPKISTDGKNWKTIDSTKVQIERKPNVSTSAIIDLNLGRDTLWVSAQEVITSSHVNSWMEVLEKHSFVSRENIGKSLLGEAIDGLKIGDATDKAMIVVMSRQHPPEVTGYLAMQSFVETIAGEGPLADSFRKKYNTYVVPLANPDGVNNGHWRHGYGGVDLNRDWGDFNHPETSAIRDYFLEKVKISGGKIYFFADFHSTWEDIYYTIDPAQKGNMPGLVPQLILGVGEELSNYKPNIRPSPVRGNTITSSSYFFSAFGAESLIFELGDNTPRSFIKEKGEVTATKLMELLME